jgi:hypothetical protein
MRSAGREDAWGCKESVLEFGNPQLQLEAREFVQVTMLQPLRDIPSQLPQSRTDLNEELKETIILFPQPFLPHLVGQVVILLRERLGSLADVSS